MKVAVGSTNPVKIAAVKEAFSSVWPEKEWDVEGVSVSSGVSDQPMSPEESIKGAKNRAKRALAALHADFGVGLEGGLQKVGKYWFDCGWIIVCDREGTIGISTSIWMHTPAKMMKYIKKGLELGHVDDLFFKQTNSKQLNGHFGLMTNDIITRSHAYRDAVTSALARFIHPEIYE
jgi:inosine/xanthosine triphosphatase